MSDDQKPNAADDVKKAFGLLFRAAKTAVETLPTKRFEDVVTQGAKEVGRAIENVADTIDKEIFRGGSGARKQEAAPPSSSAATDDAPIPPEQQARISEDAPKDPPPK